MRRIRIGTVSIYPREITKTVHWFMRNPWAPHEQTQQSVEIIIIIIYYFSELIVI